MYLSWDHELDGLRAALALADKLRIKAPLIAERLKRRVAVRLYMLECEGCPIPKGLHPFPEAEGEDDGS